MSASDFTFELIIPSTLILFSPIIAIVCLFDFIVDYLKKHTSFMTGAETNNTTTDNNTKSQRKRKNDLAELNEIKIGSSASLDNYKFNIKPKNKGKVLPKQNSCIYFNEDCIIQGKGILLNPNSFYYEIELLNITKGFQLLLGYASKTNYKFYGSHVLLNNKICGIVINHTQYPNTFIHTFKIGDIIGCFYDRLLSKVTFTYNGNDLYYCELHSRKKIPTIYSTKGILFRYNLGDQPFLCRRANHLKLGLISNYIQENPPDYGLKSSTNDLINHSTSDDQQPYPNSSQQPPNSGVQPPPPHYILGIPHNSS